MPLALNFEDTNTQRELFRLPTALVWHSRRAHKPHQEHPSIWRAVGFREKLRLSAGKWSENAQSVLRGRLFYVAYCAPRSSTNFDHCSSSESRCKPPSRTCGEAISRETQAAVLRKKSVYYRYPAGTPAEVPTAARYYIDVSVIFRSNT